MVVWFYKSKYAQILNKKLELCTTFAIVVHKLLQMHNWLALVGVGMANQNTRFIVLVVLFEAKAHHFFAIFNIVTVIATH